MSSAILKIIALFGLLSCGCAARGQSITVTLKGKSENLTTIDRVGATTCNGIQENLSTVDGATARAGSDGRIVEVVTVADAVSAKLKQLMRVTVSFPVDCKVSLAGNVASCTSPNSSVTLAIAGNSGASVDSPKVTITQP